MSSEIVIKRNIVLNEKEVVEDMIVKSEFYPSSMMGNRLADGLVIFLIVP